MRFILWSRIAMMIFPFPTIYICFEKNKCFIGLCISLVNRRQIMRDRHFVKHRLCIRMLEFIPAVLF